MRKIYVLILILVLFLSVSVCYATMSGTVIDSETGRTIEGAVVLVEWTYTSGKWIGLRTTSSYKVVEKVTDKEGKFKVFGVLNPFVDPPTIVIYKKGYVAWRNDFIFPEYKKRNDFHWQNNIAFRLEQFKNDYSHSKHISFMSMGGLSLSSTKLEKAYSWEDILATKERVKSRRK